MEFGRTRSPKTNTLQFDLAFNYIIVVNIDDVTKVVDALGIGQRTLSIAKQSIRCKLHFYGNSKLWVYIAKGWSTSSRSV